MAKNYEKSIHAFLGEGTEFKGVVSFEGTVRVDGILDGEVTSDDTFIIGAPARVTATIKAGTVVVMGRLDGKIEASQKCEIRAGGQLRGDIFTPSIYIEEGAVFEGTCNMTNRGGGSGKAAQKPAANAQAQAANRPPQPQAPAPQKAGG